MFHPLVNPAPSRGSLLICLFLMMSTHKRAEFRKRREAVQGSSAPTCKEVMELRYAPARPLRRRIASTPRTMRRRGSGAAIGGGKFDAPAVLWSFLTEEKGHCVISSFSLPRQKQTGAVSHDAATKPPGHSRATSPGSRFRASKAAQSRRGATKNELPPGPPLAHVKYEKRLHMLGGSGCRGFLETSAFRGRNPLQNRRSCSFAGFNAAAMILKKAAPSSSFLCSKIICIPP